MLTLRAQQNAYRLLLPKNFLHKKIEEKYSNILQSKHSFFYSPIDFLNESIQKVEVLGFNNATVQQQQTGRGKPILNPNRVNENNFLHTSTDYNYRSEANPLALIDRTLNVTFRHTVGYLNYLMLFENFWLQYSRDESYVNLPKQFSVDLFNEENVIISRILLSDPVIDSMDMLSFDYTQPVAQDATFRVTFKYSNIDFEFPDITEDPYNDDGLRATSIPASSQVGKNC